MNPGLPSPGAALAEAARLALTAAIATNPEARRCSERLAGRTLAVETLDARFVVHFEPGAVRVEAGDTPADATVRGSPVDVGATLTGAEETAAVFGDATIFEDFRESFSPLAGMRDRFDLPGKYVVEDIGDAVRLGVKAVQSALEGLAGAANRRRP